MAAKKTTNNPKLLTDIQQYVTLFLLRIGESMNYLNVIFGIIILLALFALVPIAVIWSLNTLFPVLAIPLTWKTWLATAFLGSLIGGTRLSFRK